MATVGTAGTSKSNAGYKIFILPKAHRRFPCSRRTALGAKQAGKELGDTVTYNGPTTVIGAAQVPFIDTAARQGYNAHHHLDPRRRTRSRRR